MSIFDRKLTDLTVGDVAKGYAVYWAVGAVAALIVAVIGFSMVSSANDEAERSFGFGGGPGFDGAGSSASLETSPSDRKVTRAEYRSVTDGTTKDDLVDRFGEPGSTGPDITDLSGSAPKECLVYSRARGQDAFYLFCFDDDERLVSKSGL